MGSLLGNLRLTFAIAAMAVCSIAIAIAAVLAGLFVSLLNTASDDAVHEVASATRIAAEILQVNLPSLEIVSDEAGDVAALTMRSMPRFRTHDVIDTVTRVAGQDAAVFTYDTEVSPDLVVGTTSLLKPDGERLVDSSIAAGTPLFESMMANQQVRTEETINGVGYFTLYQPIAMVDGTVIGALLVAVARAPIEAVVGHSLWTLVVIGGAALLVIGVLALLLSRQLTKPIPRLSNVMSAIAEGQLDTDVPYTERRNEIGAMARAVEVFRANSQRVAELDEQTNRHLQTAADHTGQLQAISTAQLVAEFTLGGQLITANSNFLALMGYRLDEVQGQPNARFLFDADPHSAEYNVFWQDLARGEFKAGEYRRRAKDGSEIWIQSIFSPIVGLDGVPYKVVQFATDVSARKKAVAAVGAGLAMLADGDLTQTIDTPFPPEFEGLRQALNGTVQRFADVLGQLRTTSRSLKAATGEMLSGANDLAERTTRQATTIEETSAAMEQLAATVAGNAGMAQEAAGKAVAVSRTAAESGSVMSEVTRPWSASRSPRPRSPTSLA